MISIKTKKGFTLIELLVVATIIAVLAAVATVGYSQSKAKARDSERIVDLKSIEVALTMYHDEHQLYAPEFSGWDTSKGSAPNAAEAKALVGSNWSSDPNSLSALVPNYIDILPVDPINSGEYYYLYEPAQYNYYESQFGKYCYGVSCAYMMSAKLEVASTQGYDLGCDTVMNPEHSYCIVAGGAQIHTAH